MTMSRNLATALCASLTVLAAGLTATPAMADSMMSEAAPSRVITVPKDKSLSFRLDEPATKIVVAQPDIAEVVATTDRSFYVRGIDLGSTNLLVYGPGGRLMEVIDVRVGADAASLQQDIAQAFPREKIGVQSLDKGVLLTGTVSNPGVAARAKSIAEKFADGGVTSMLKITGSQVMLEVRIMEAARSSLQDFGLGATISGSNFNYTFGAGLVGAPATLPGQQPPLVGLAGNSSPNGALRFTGRLGSASIDAQIAALEDKGVVRTLARPNLVAMSGEKASFLAGGEFPFPVPAGNNLISIEFRPYGVKLNFTPTVLDDGTIKLLVEPEVSQLDTTNTLRIDTITVPALTVRRTSTTVEMQGGQSLAIGGLFQRGYENDLRQIPGLGEIPILSALFRSSRWKRNETELLIIVTPRLVSQVDFDSAKDRVIPGTEPSAFDFLVNGKAHDKALRHDDMLGPSATPPPAAPAAPPQLRGSIAPPTLSTGK
jgi:pilus assembly protein CpaC